MIYRTCVVAVALTALVQDGRPGAIGTGQPTASATVRVRGEVSTPLELGADDLASMPRKGLSLRDHEGKDTRFEGVLLSEILKKAGVNRGEPLRGGALTLFLLVEASDGYQVNFALAELDESFTDRVVLLADHRDGKPLADREGPFRIVVPDEKKPARWVRQVTALTIRKLPSEAERPATSPR